MQTLIEKIQRSYRPHCTQEQARQLLEGLRAAYQSLPLSQRSLFRSAITHMSRVQSVLETSEESLASAELET